MTPLADRTKRVRLDLTPEENHRLRVVAAQAGLSIAAYTRRVVLADLDAAEHHGKRPAKPRKETP
jgi:hypothetical protein